MHEINERRERLGEYHRLCVELQSHEDRFFKYFGVFRGNTWSIKAEYCEVHNELEKTNWNKRKTSHLFEVSSFSILYYSSFQRLYKNNMHFLKH
jgi:hypothetical protein